MFSFTAGPNRTPNTNSNERVGEQEMSPAARLLRSFAKCLVLLTLVVLSVPSATWAQVLYGSVVGTVTDSNGAAVSGAKVEVTNRATGAVNSAMTDDSGVYKISDLQVGAYKLTISKSSFKTTIDEDVKIEANKTYRFDSAMEVGGVAETVVVTSGQDSLLQTDRGDVNITKSEREINNLPLFGSLGRNYQTLLSLIPGTARGTGGFFIGNGAGEDNSAAGNPQRSMSYNVNGVSRLQNNTKIDGASIIYPWLPGNTVYVPPAEAIQEVNIVTNAFDAEQGLAGGAAVNVTIKSGGNDFHGVGWGYDTNSRFQSRNFFQPANQPKIPKNIVSQFGYAFSGPVILPHFGEGGPKVWNGKNKLFFFTDLEKTTQRNAAGTTRTIAPLTLRPDANGNVSFAGTGTVIYDPASNPDPRLRTPFPGNIVPANRIDVAALELIRRLPQPTGPGNTNNFASTGTGEFNRTNVDVKINYAGTKFSTWGRYSRSPTNIFDPPIFGLIGGGALNGGQLGTAPGLVQVVGLGGTYSFSSNVVLDGNVGYTRQRLGAQNIDIDQPYGLTLLKIPGTNGPDQLQNGFPFFSFTGWNNLGNDNTGNPFLFRDNQYVAAANLSWVKGNHSFRFGGDWLNPQINHFQPQGAAFQTVRGSFQFSGTATALEGCDAPNTGTNVCAQPGTVLNANAAAANTFNSWAAFLLGLPSGAGKADQLRNPNSVWWQQYGLYARDHWQIGRNLTLIYGLRWERFPIPRKDHSGINRFDPATGQVVTGGLGGTPFNGGATVGAGLFLPRIGIAYRFNDKTVFRGGYGQSSDPRPFQDVRNAFPIVNIWQMPAVSFNGLSGTSGFIPVTTLRQGLINTSSAPDLNKGSIPLPPNTGTTTFPKDVQRDRIHSFNVFIERQLPAKFVAQVGYVGTRAVGQMGFININPSAPGTSDAGRPLIGFGINADISSIQPYGNTTYDGLQAQFTRRWASSLFGVAYTWSKTINFADNDGGPRIAYTPEKQRNRGPASYDRTHNLQSYLVYDLPFGKGQKWAKDGVASKIFGGFQVSGLMSVMSGMPFYVVQNTAPNLLARGSGQIPNQVSPNISTVGGIGTPAQRGTDGSGPWFTNTVLGGPAIFGATCTSNCAWALENGARFGSGGRNNLRGPDFFEMDSTIYRTFTISERVKFELRAEALNMLNHANFNLPDANVNSNTFGYITSTFGPNQQRQWRFGARLSF